jgi:hypothetical protein
MRRSCLAAFTIAIVMSLSADGLACGDKFLRIGRSPRFRRYASVHPAAILVYAPRWTPKGRTAFEALLRQGGHQPLTVTTPAAMKQAFATGKYEMVIADHADTAAVRDEIAGAESKPPILPVVYKGKKAEQEAARSTYGCVLRPEKMSNFQALAEIDRLFDLQVKGQSAAGPRH